MDKIPERRDPTVQASYGRTRIYVIGTITTAGLAVISILLLALIRPDNTSTGTIIMGLLLPIITAFLGASIGHLGAQIDGRLTQLLELTAKSSEAIGKSKQQDVNKVLGQQPVPVEIIGEPTVLIKETKT